MKKLLSIFLALAMLISLIPAAFAADTEAEAGIKIVYDFTDKDVINTDLPINPNQTTTIYQLDPTVFTYDKTNGFWEYAEDSNENDLIQSGADTGVRIDMSNNAFQVGSATEEGEYWIAFKLYVPKTGTYALATDVNSPSKINTKNYTYINAYIFTTESVASKGNTIKDKILAGSTGTNQVKTESLKYGTQGDTTLSFDKPMLLQEGEHYFVFNPTAAEGITNKINMRLLSLTLTENGTGTKSVPMISSLTSTTENGVTTVTATAAKMSNGDLATDVTYSYAVADDDKAKAEIISGNVVKGLADGTATIIATATKDGLSSSKSIEVDVTAPVVEPVVTPDYEEAFGEDTYEIEENVNVNPDVKVVAYAKGGNLSPTTLSAKKIGDVYEIKTDATIGDYTFRYWARGLENAEKGNRRIVSLENNFTYSAEKGDANWLIAVYTKDGEDAETEYFNANGQLIPDATDATRPYMLGYGYATDWKDNGNGIKEAVYGNGVQSYNITVNGKSDLYKYGAKIVCPTVEVPENKYFWGWTKKVGNAAVELVSTETNYTFYAWEDCVVEPMFGDSELVRGDIIARKILISKLDIGNNESVIKAEFIGFGDAVERGITLGAKDYAMTRDDATQFAIINNVNATEISAYAILEGGTKYVYTYVAPTAE